MDCEKAGRLILCLRKEKSMTQKELAEQMQISDKTVSKWERGQGYPDVSLLPKLSELLGVNIEKILSGELESNDFVGGNMKKIKLYVCPECGNILTATGEASISCCGRKLAELVAEKPGKEHELKVETVENEWFLSAEHEMTKEHYISFVALVTGDKLLIVKNYPEWNLQMRLPKLGHGKLYHYCMKHGLFYQLI